MEILRIIFSHFCIMIMALIVLAGCLQTRSEVEDRRKMKVQVAGLQKHRANEVSKVNDIEGQMREMSGRIDDLAHRLSLEKKSNQELNDEVKQLRLDLDERLKLYLEEIEKYDDRLAQVDTKVVALIATIKRQRSPRKTGKTKKKAGKGGAGPYTRGNAFFGKKKWKEAISAYQIYRERNPQGRRYSEATYKIGVAFQELKLYKEAKVFFEEVVDRFPKVNAAKKSIYRLGQLKKKIGK